ncbi:hypothetical protein BT96DRAFT_1020573 [Gymnopus androsaceus JB14]|uniref:Uncharacterized protein n=1 Tax=Gymnopus androsaceus JB14 TaxID=1447944 RepID=A0A6A4HJZ6_9AGAR|nr:hypothetical protein BT96DRAFT_1020573 [Gymnopus androsaceus JB14]
MNTSEPKPGYLESLGQRVVPILRVVFEHFPLAFAFSFPFGSMFMFKGIWFGFAIQIISALLFPADYLLHRPAESGLPRIREGKAFFFSAMYAAGGVAMVHFGIASGSSGWSSTLLAFFIGIESSIPILVMTAGGLYSLNTWNWASTKLLSFHLSNIRHQIKTAEAQVRLYFSTRYQNLINLRFRRVVRTPVRAIKLTKPDSVVSQNGDV